MVQKYKTLFSNKTFVYSFALSIIFIICALIINFYAVGYATIKASNPVTDIILSNTRAYDVDGIFIYGPILLWLWVIYLLLKDPKTIPFTVKSIALFVIIRSVFVTLTHIGPFPTQIPIDSLNFASHFLNPDLLRIFFTGNDLFFSGHTGLPFLLALVFWDRIYLRYIFIVLSIFFGVIVLLGHLHYSIDVAAAFFITYAIFHIALKFFKKDRQIFFQGV